MNATITGIDVSCFSGSNGNINLSLSGGVFPYTFNWINGETSEDLQNISVGNYQVTITDLNLCSVQASKQIYEPSTLMSLSINGTPAVCSGQAGGSADLTVSGGNPPYTYIWNYGQATQDISNIVAGNYEVTITDAHLCRDTISTTIDEPNALILIPDQHQSTCGASDGSAEVNVIGGTGAYSYFWSNGSTNLSTGNVSSNSYTVTVSDANLCSASLAINVNDKNGPQASSYALTEISCAGYSDATAVVFATGGAIPFVYEWSTGSTDQTEMNLYAGIYTISVTDTNQCQTITTLIIEEPDMLTGQILVTDISCFGGNNGIANLTVYGGTSPYSYIWSSGQMSEDITNLSIGTYTVTATDANSCTTVLSANIISPSTAIIVSLDQTNIACHGAADGSGVVTPSGGVSPYNWLWSTGQTTNNISGLGAGSYSVTVTDMNGCTRGSFMQITEPANLMTTFILGTTVSCKGGNDGVANLTVLGGTIPYSYLWNNGATSEDINSVTAGNYVVTITDGNGCTTVASKTILEPSASLSGNILADHVNCYNGTDGSANLAITGGTPPYSYAWSTGATSEDLNNLSSGSFQVTVTDAHDCLLQESVTIGQPGGMLTSSIVGTNVSYNGGGDGSVDVTVSGGTPDYVYSWNYGYTSEDLHNIGGGSYTVTVTDQNGCTTVSTVSIIEPTLMQSDAIQTNVSCYSGNNGAINLTVTGGVSPYSYQWNNGSTGEDISGLSAGIYCVSITDDNSYVISNCYTISEPSLLDISLVTTSVSCTGDATGSIELTVSGGTLPYSYLWSSFQTTQDISLILAGNYVVTVTDGKSCSLMGTATMQQPTASLQCSITGINVRCNGGSDGISDLSVSGGTAPFTFNWNFGQTTEDLSNISAGNYQVTVTDANNCTSSTNVLVTQPAVLSIIPLQTNSTCGNSDGYASVSVSGSTGPYTYNWSIGQVSSFINNIPAGAYAVTITDSSNCSSSIVINVNDLGAPSASISAYGDVTCSGLNDGWATVSAVGGNPPYLFSWTNGGTDITKIGLAGGIYIVTVTDSNNCVSSATAYIEEPLTLTLSASSTKVRCKGATNGTASLTIGGGVIPYTYSWNNGQTIEDLTNLGTGIYNVVVSDANGCSISASVNVIEPSTSIVASLTKKEVDCFGSYNGTVDLTVTGGTPGYTYQWNIGQITEDLSSLGEGQYEVTISDANGCTTSIATTITEPPAIAGIFTASDISCNGLDNGAIFVDVSGGVTPYSYIWNSGDSSEDLSNLTPGSYEVTICDSNNCELVKSTSIEQPEPLTTQAQGTNVRCFGKSTGKINMIVSGGTSPYAYNWNSGQTTEDIQGLFAGGYDVLVTDAHSCTSEFFIGLTQPSASLALNSIGTSITCFSNNDGNIDLQVTGGTLPYSYLWNTGNQTEDLTNLAQGNYEVTVTDTNKCTAYVEYTIVEPSVIQTTTTGNDISCFSSKNGSIELTVVGGISPYTYIWNNNNTTKDVTGLDEGLFAVTVTDQNGCSAIDDQNIVEPAILQLNLSGKDLNCKSDTNGTVDLLVTGGTLPYQYLWNTGSTNEDLFNKKAGTYSVTISDAHSCSATSSITLKESNLLILNIEASDIKCMNQINGFANLTVIGGTADYSYLWSSGQTSQDINQLVAGFYSVTVTDKQQCRKSKNVVISESALLTANATSSNIRCHGETNGAVNLTVSGGNIPYDFEWGNGATTEDLSSLSAGFYTVTITDANYCTANTAIVIYEPYELEAYITSFLDDDFEESCTGSVTVTPEGGAYPYYYQWSVSEEEESVETEICEGDVTITVTDANDCQVEVTHHVSQIPPPPVALFDSTYDGCPPYKVNFSNLSTYADSYYWDFGDGGSSKEENPTYTYYESGQYTVTLLAANSIGQDIYIDDTISVTVHENPVPYFKVVPTIVKIPDEAANFYDLSLYGYSYLWDLGDGTSSTERNPVHYYEQEGVYDVMLTVTTQYGCIDSFLVDRAVTAKNMCMVQFPDAFSPNVTGSPGGSYSSGDFSNDIFFPLWQDIGDYRLEIFNRWGELIFVSEDITIGWDGYYRNKLCKQDVYIWQVTYTCDDEKIHKVGDVTLVY